jgi:hypothetical protein
MLNLSHNFRMQFHFERSPPAIELNWPAKKISKRDDDCPDGTEDVD